MSRWCATWMSVPSFACEAGVIPSVFGEVLQIPPGIYRSAVIGGIRQKEPDPALERYVQHGFPRQVPVAPELQSAPRLRLN